MKSHFLIVALLALGLTSCGKPAGDTQGPHGHGRYAGVGLYFPGALWSKMVAGAPATDPSKARTTDDDEVIVVVDSETGEIRQCGNLSGYCVGMNPWTKALLASQTLPVQLTEHAAPKPSGPPASAKATSKPAN